MKRSRRRTPTVPTPSRPSPTSSTLRSCSVRNGAMAKQGSTPQPPETRFNCVIECSGSALAARPISSSQLSPITSLRQSPGSRPSGLGVWERRETTKVRLLLSHVPPRRSRRSTADPDCLDLEHLHCKPSIPDWLTRRSKNKLARWWSRLKRSERSSPLRTTLGLDGASQGPRIHYRDARSISIRECLRLQGVPDGVECLCVLFLSALVAQSSRFSFHRFLNGSPVRF